VIAYHAQSGNILYFVKIHSFIHSYLFINKMEHKIYKNRIGVTEGQPGKQYALMVAPKKIKHKKRVNQDDTK